MRTMRQFHRRINYTSIPVRRLKCEYSLAHSLRIAPPTGERKAENLKWNHELEANNLIWANGQLSRLNDWSPDARLELLYQIAPQPKIHKQSYLQEQQRKYRLKIKKAVESERKNGNVQAADFLQQILATSGYVSYSRIDTFAELPMQRKNQRINMLKTYLNAHNQLYSRPCENSVFVQEGIFKIPHQWNVDAETLSLPEYIRFTEKFLTAHFPEYPIMAIIGHDDERNIQQQTGHHPHYFLSGRNEETGEYDLHKRQIQVVNNFIRQNYPEDELLPADSILSPQQTKVFGEYFQRMVRDYTNEHLFHEKGLHMEFSPESEQRSETRKRMNREAMQPILQRSYNYYSYQLELIEEQIATAEEEHAALTDACLALSQRHTMITDEIAHEQTVLTTLQEKIAEQRINETRLNGDCAHLSTLKQELTENVGKTLVSIFRRVILALNARDNGLQQQQLKPYLSKIVESALKLPPALSQIIISELATIESSTDHHQALDKD